MATPSCDEAGGREKIFSRQDAPSWWRLRAIVSLKSCGVSWLKSASFDIPQNFRPELNTFPDRNCVRMRRYLFGTGKHVQTPENYFAPLVAIPSCQGVSAPGKRQM